MLLTALHARVNLYIYIYIYIYIACHKLVPLCDICTPEQCSVCSANSYLSDGKCLCDEGYTLNQVICESIIHI